MKKFEWRERLNLNITTIDIQHKKIIDYMNLLHDGLMEKAREKVVRNVLRYLEFYAKTHFNYEEEVMEFFEFPDFPRHRELHNSFKVRLEDLKKKFETTNVPSVTQVLIFLQEWITKHIAVEDRKIAEYLKENEIEL